MAFLTCIDGTLHAVYNDLHALIVAFYNFFFIIILRSQTYTIYNAESLVTVYYMEMIVIALRSSHCNKKTVIIPCYIQHTVFLWFYPLNC